MRDRHRGVLGSFLAVLAVALLAMTPVVILFRCSEPRADRGVKSATALRWQHQDKATIRDRSAPMQGIESGVAAGAEAEIRLQRDASDPPVYSLRVFRETAVDKREEIPSSRHQWTVHSPERATIRLRNLRPGHYTVIARTMSAYQRADFDIFEPRDRAVVTLSFEHASPVDPHRSTLAGHVTLDGAPVSKIAISYRMDWVGGLWTSGIAAVDSSGAYQIHSRLILPETKITFELAGARPLVHVFGREVESESLPVNLVSLSAEPRLILVSEAGEPLPTIPVAFSAGTSDQSIRVTDEFGACSLDALPFGESTCRISYWAYRGEALLELRFHSFRLELVPGGPRELVRVIPGLSTPAVWLDFTSRGERVPEGTLFLSVREFKAPTEQPLWIPHPFSAQRSLPLLVSGLPRGAALEIYSIGRELIGHASLAALSDGVIPARVQLAGPMGVAQLLILDPSGGLVESARCALAGQLDVYSSSVALPAGPTPPSMASALSQALLVRAGDMYTLRVFPAVLDADVKILSEAGAAMVKPRAALAAGVATIQVSARGCVLGRVTCSKDLAAIPGANVALYDAGGRKVSQTLTAFDGSFCLEGSADSAAQIRVSMPGRLAEEVPVVSGHPVVISLPATSCPHVRLSNGAGATPGFR